MGEAKRRSRPVGRCVYCGKSDLPLSDEHAIPYALGGKLVLRAASCGECAKVTSTLELHLLRGHWWPYRRLRGFATRRPAEQPEDFLVEIVNKATGIRTPARISADSYPFLTLFYFDPPKILSGMRAPTESVVGRVAIVRLQQTPSSVLIEGRTRPVDPFTEELSFPINMSASDVARFLAKVALVYAVSRIGMDAFESLYADKIVLGDGHGALTYVGRASAGGPLLADHGYHGLQLHPRGAELSVYIQLFRDAPTPPPIYEVVVGTLRMTPGPQPQSPAT
jgi:hypothetical protein